MIRKHIPAMLKTEERSFRRNDFDHMSLYYYDEELHEKALRQEGYEEGYKEGFEEGSIKTREEAFRRMMKLLKKKKFSDEEIQSDLLEIYPDHADLVKRVLESE